VLVLALAVALGAAASTTAAPAPGAGSTAARSHGEIAALGEKIAARINIARRQAGLRPLRVHDGLATAADAHARAMAKQGFFSHTSADGASPQERIARHYGGRTISETILWRAPELSPEQTVSTWLASPAHRAILLSGSLRDLGVGVARAGAGMGAFSGMPATIVVADFGAR
jgi:uncharacterized protein YkwD